MDERISLDGLGIEQELPAVARFLGIRIGIIYLLARRQAWLRRNPRIGEEHMLLGMIEEGASPALEMLTLDMSVDNTVLKGDLEAILPPSQLFIGLVTPSHRLIENLGKASRGGKRIGSEHFLIAMAGIREGNLGVVLERHNITEEGASEAFIAWRERQHIARAEEETLEKQ